jgi:hypothetical protein
MPSGSTIPLTSSNPGPAGRDGINAFSFTSADVNGYNGAANLLLTLQNVQWSVVGQAVEVANVGTFKVLAVDGTGLVLTLQPSQIRGTPPFNIPTGTEVSPSGYPGPQGIQGAKGDKGDTGATGTTGTAATVAVGTTATGAPGSNAAVTNAGTSAAAVLNFTIPRGDVGATGAQGPQGSTGAQGVPGATGGQGVQGPKGDTGAAGAAGAPGVNSLATTTANGLLKQISGNATDFVDGTNACQPLAAAIQPTIWIARLRCNAIGNPNFEINQRSPGTVLSLPAGTQAGFQVDRWKIQKVAGTGAVSCNQPAVTQLVPGTNFAITQSGLSVGVTTAQGALAAGDNLQIQQFVEGPMLRELINDVTSLTIAVSCTASLTFAVVLRDSVSGVSYVHLCNYTNSPSIQWFTIPNIPKWAGGGTFPLAPGGVGYSIAICLAAGSTFIAPSVDTWVSGNFAGAAGMTNFLGLSAGATFNLWFVQHEPGALCTTPIDKPWQQNYEECLRYYCKSYDYAVAPGANASLGALSGFNGAASTAGTDFQACVRFPKPMAVACPATPFVQGPGIYLWTPAGTPNAVRDAAGATDRGVSSISIPGSMGFRGVTLGSALSASSYGVFHYKADTGW